jgi:hypothetical protein
MGYHSARETTPRFKKNIFKLACRHFVPKVKDLYPNVTIIWKAPAAMVRTVHNMTSYIFLVKM